MTFKLLSWEDIVALGLAQGYPLNRVSFCSCHPSQSPSEGPKNENLSEGQSQFAGVPFKDWEPKAR